MSSDGEPFTQRAISAPTDARWRLFAPPDMPFLYDLVTNVDPRWWRFSRYGLEPSRFLETAHGHAAGATVLDGFGKPVAFALLFDAGASGTGILDYFALPTPESHALARRFAPELVAAAFAGASARRLYHERFENDPDLLGALSPHFEVEVTYPEFAIIDGRYEDRVTSVLTADRFAAWHETTRQ